MQYEMKSIQLLLLAFLFFGNTEFSQMKKWEGRGFYSIAQLPKTEDSTSKEDNEILSISAIQIPPFRYGQVLELKRWGRFEIIDYSPIPDIGLNTDNPTIYGRYHRKGDSLFLRCEKSIQHFAYPEKSKQTQKIILDKEYVFYILADGSLQCNVHWVWRKREG